MLNMQEDPEGAAVRMADPRFKDCVLITPFNKAVFQFSIHRAQTWARSMGQPLFWMQAIDKPPSGFADDYRPEELKT